LPFSLERKAKVPNAKDLQIDWKLPSFLLAGYPGGGKSVQAWTLPGKKFGYVFDPNTLASWKGLDIEYELFLPDIDDINLAAQTLKTGIGDKPRRRKEPRTYMDWEADFDSRAEDGFFKDFDYIVMDSCTGFLDIIMDRLLYLNGRTGKQPEQADWAAQVNIATNVFRTISSYGCGLMATAHLDFKQNDVSKKLFHHMTVTGKLRIRLPQMFNNIFVCHADADEKGRFWQFQTAPDKEYPTVRSQWGDLETYVDATIQDFDRPQDYGLGALLKRYGYAVEPDRTTVAVKGNSVATGKKRK
jgi:AAA domain